MLDRDRIALDMIRKILDDDANYQTDALKLGGIWGWCTWNHKYIRSASNDVIEVQPLDNAGATK